MRIKIRDKKQFIEMFNQLFKNNHINKINAICIDSRKIKKNDIYIPIKGKKHDGHNYINNAINSGAIKCFSEKNNKHNKIIKINSAINIINKIAQKWKSISNHKIIGITGSNGKTTTKDLLYHVLSKKYSCSKSRGNYNSQIGFPISYLNSKINDDYCILEYGANKNNEINNLCQIIKPDYSLITNISNAHIKNFKSMKNIINTKKTLLTILKKNDTAFINLDDNHISKINMKCNRITFSFKKEANFIGLKNSNKKNEILINNKILTIPNNISHLDNLILSVYAIATYFNIEHNKIENYFNNFKIPSGRGDVIKIRGLNIIDDCYNANPSSVIFAINRIKSLKINNKAIFVFGDMLELGQCSKKEHEKIAVYLNNSKIDIILTYGKASFNTYKKLNNSFKLKKHFYDIYYMKKCLFDIAKKGDLIYVKASRSMEFEKLYHKGKA